MYMILSIDVGIRNLAMCQFNETLVSHLKENHIDFIDDWNRCASIRRLIQQRMIKNSGDANKNLEKE